MGDREIQQDVFSSCQPLSLHNLEIKVGRQLTSKRSRNNTVMELRFRSKVPIWCIWERPRLMFGERISVQKEVTI